MLPSYIINKLRDNPLLENEFIYTLGIDTCKKNYEIFEKVLTSVSKKSNRDWRVIYHSTKKDPENYVLLCVSMILIDKLLRVEFRMDINERHLLLGDKFNQIVRDYYRYI